MYSKNNVGGRMNYLEHIQYESRPFIYGLTSIFCLHSGPETLLLKSGALLLGACSALVLKARYDYRRGEKKQSRHHR